MKMILRALAFAAVLSAALAMPASGQIFHGNEGYGADSLSINGWRIIRVTSTTCGDGGLKAALADSTGPRKIVFDVGGLFAYYSCGDTSGGDVADSVAVLGTTAPYPGVILQAAPSGNRLFDPPSRAGVFIGMTFMGVPCAALETSGCTSNAHVVFGGTTDNRHLYFHMVSSVGGQGGGEFFSFACNGTNTRCGWVTLHNVLLGGGYASDHTCVLFQADDDADDGWMGVTFTDIAALDCGHRSPYITGGNTSDGGSSGNFDNLQIEYWYSYNNNGNRNFHFRGNVMGRVCRVVQQPGSETDANWLARWDQHLTQAADSAELYFCTQNIIRGVKESLTTSIWDYIGKQDGSLIGPDSLRNGSLTDPTTPPLFPVDTTETIAEFIAKVENREIGNYRRVSCYGDLVDSWHNPMDSALYARRVVGTAGYPGNATGYVSPYPPAVPSSGVSCADTNSNNIPDSADVRYGLSADSATGDADFDDVDNITEIALGHDPTIPGSGVGGVQPTFQAEAMFVYKLARDTVIRVYGALADTINVETASGLDYSIGARRCFSGDSLIYVLTKQAVPGLTLTDSATIAAEARPGCTVTTIKLFDFTPGVASADHDPDPLDWPGAPAVALASGGVFIGRRRQ